VGFCLCFCLKCSRKESTVAKSTPQRLQLIVGLLTCHIAAATAAGSIASVFDANGDCARRSGAEAGRDALGSGDAALWCCPSLSSWPIFRMPSATIAGDGARGG